MLRYNSSLTHEACHDIASKLIEGEHEKGSVFYLHNAPDFIIESKKEMIAVEVKTTLRKNTVLHGTTKRDLQRQLKKYGACKDVTKIIRLEISLADFPDIKYSIKGYCPLNRDELQKEEDV